LPFSLLYEIVAQRSLRIDSEDSLCDFISKGIETNQEMFGLLEFVRWEYCSTGVMDDFFDLLSGYFCEINASMWASLRARLVLPNGTWKQFPPSLKKGKYGIDVPDGIIAHLTRGCGGNVHDRHVVDVTCGSFEKETWGVNPHSGRYDDDPGIAAKNAADLEDTTFFFSAHRQTHEHIRDKRNNWICYDFKKRRIVPTHYTIRTHQYGQGDEHLKSWLVETSADGKDWEEVGYEMSNKQLNGEYFTGTFPVADGGEWECRFIRLVQIGRNHYGTDVPAISAWEIFGSLIE
jgi:hypothetical protein